MGRVDCLGEIFMRMGNALYVAVIVLLLAVPGFSQTKGDEILNSVCLDCHDSDMMNPELRAVPSEWKKSWHFQNGIACHDCHGGDPKDSAMAMSPERGFSGKPQYGQVPEFCGKCHIGILKNYLESGHGKALKSNGSGPNCVTCHGSHGIVMADIDIINETLCSRCHTYDRAKAMKQALSVTENKLRDVRNGLRTLKASGVFTGDEEKTLFSTEASFRTLFHSVDVGLIKERTDEYIYKLDQIESREKQVFQELAFRRKFSAFLMCVFLGIGIVLVLMSKAEK